MSLKWIWNECYDPETSLKWVWNELESYFVLQSLRRVLPSTTSYYKIKAPSSLSTTLYYKACTNQHYFVLQSLHSTLHTLHLTLHTLHSRIHTLLSTLHTSHSKLHTPHFKLSTPHFTLHTTLHTAHSKLYTPRFTLHTCHTCHTKSRFATSKRNVLIRFVSNSYRHSEGSIRDKRHATSRKKSLHHPQTPYQETITFRYAFGQNVTFVFSCFLYRMFSLTIK